MTSMRPCTSSIRILDAIAFWREAQHDAPPNDLDVARATRTTCLVVVTAGNVHTSWSPCTGCFKRDAFQYR